MEYLIWIGLFLPLISSIGLMLTGYRLGRHLTGLVACTSIFLAFICFAVLSWQIAQGAPPLIVTLFQWIPLDPIRANFTLHFDSLSSLMTLIITGVGFLIHVYSIGYMDHEEDYARYFSFLNFFVFAMLLLVLAEHVLLLFVGWEGVGLASYLLIGFWYQRPSAARAATKAFVVNRIGDLGLLLGLLLTFYLFGTGDITEISARAEQEFAVGAPIITVLTLLYFVGSVGKSAQLPLHVWLPDAMEGPTPVSALIHAATMVTAGVYLVVRLHVLFLLAPYTLQLIGVVGGVTALFAALCAIGQNDLKRVLAYSTVSQLGLMFLACGVTAFYPAMFHLTTHAFMKALLFLSAGNVVHMMHGTTLMDKMGGLSKIFTKTHWLFLIGVLAMSGVPPLAAFFSKDLILEEEYQAGLYTLFYVGLIASILTAFYLTRAYYLTFMGPSHLDNKEFQSVHEAPNVMLTPVSVLALLSIIGGFLGFAVGDLSILEGFLQRSGVSVEDGEPYHNIHLTFETWLSIAGAFLGIGAALLLYSRYSDRLGAPIEALRRAFYIDEIYNVLLVRPLRALGRFIDSILEPYLFDGSIQGLAYTTRGTAGWLQTMQSGQIRSYVAWMTLGAAFLIAYFIA